MTARSRWCEAKDGEKPLSIAIDELNQGKVTIVGEDEE